MSTLYTFDLTGETTEEETPSEDENETWDTAFQTEVQNVTPVKQTQTETPSRHSASSRRRTPSSRRSKSGKTRSGSRRKTGTPNVFDGISREIESELRRCEDPCESASSDEDVENAGDEIVLVVQNKEQKRVRVRTTTEAPFRNLFDKYRSHAEGQGWIVRGARLTFLMDDEPIAASDTPASLDCQFDDIIDVIISPT